MGAKHSDISMRRTSSLLWLTVAAALFVPPLARGETPDASVTVELATRAAYSAVLVFHPDDVAHRRDNPAYWPRESFAYGPEAADGRILAFTGETLRGVVRLTTDALSEREQRWRGHPWTFRYRVRHGKVFVGTEDSLRYVDVGEPFPIYAKLLPESGFALANGAYAVTVYPIRWKAEPGSVTSDGKRTAYALPEFVIVFKPVEDVGKIEAAPTPVFFAGFLDGRPSPVPRPASSMWVESQHEQDPADLDSRPHILLTVPGTPLVTGFAHTVPDTDNVVATMKKLQIRRAPFVLAAEARRGALAVLVDGVWGTEGPHSSDPTVRITLKFAGLVRLGALRRQQGLTWAELEPVSRPASSVSASEMAALKQEIEDAAQRSRDFRKRLIEGSWIHGFLVASMRRQRERNGQPDPLKLALADREAALARRDGSFRPGLYELDRMQSMTSAEALTTWLIYMFDLPAQHGLELMARSDADRIAELRPLLGRR